MFYENFNLFFEGIKTQMSKKIESTNINLSQLLGRYFLETYDLLNKNQE
jgi:hypothetical protein